jgi:zona occludens toxin (predicted ATPase)
MLDVNEGTSQINREDRNEYSRSGCMQNDRNKDIREMLGLNDVISVIRNMSKEMVEAFGRIQDNGILQLSNQYKPKVHDVRDVHKYMEQS